MFRTNPVSLKALLENVASGKIQLPEFQRGWVWDDYRIRALLASIARGFPIGAVMTLRAGGDIRFKARLVEGVEEQTIGNGLDLFLLDGQQRLTSLYQALKYPGAVSTHDSRGGRIKRLYYINMLEATSEPADVEDAIVSVPESKQVTRDFGRETVLDVSTPDLEYQNHMIPTEQLFDPTRWLLAYMGYWRDGADEHPYGNPVTLWELFQPILNTFNEYQIPVIELGIETPKEAVCTVFEKVNTGGVTLTVFELVTASFAADDFALRDDWDERRERMHQEFGVLRGIQGEQFLQAVTLLATQQRRREQVLKGAPANQTPRISCQKRDILNLTLEEYKTLAPAAELGFTRAARFLHTQFVFTESDVPYNTQLVPLAALYVELNHELEPANAKEKLEHWYWAGIFSEAYGGSVETQYALDLEQVPEYIRKDTSPRLLTEADFNPERLISLRTRNSAAYKGLYALQMKSGAADWRTGDSLTLATYHDVPIDIHHIFPVAWCQSDPPISSGLYNSIINKTPIDAGTNKMIGGRAPSIYLPKLKNQNAGLDQVLQSHWLNPDLLAGDKFSESFVERGEKMLNLIGKAMGKEIPGGRDVLLNALRRASPDWAINDASDALDRSEAQEFDDDSDDDSDELGLAAYDTDDNA